MKKLFRSYMMIVVAVTILLSAIHCAFAQDEPVIPEYINNLFSKYKEINEKEKLGYEILDVTVDKPLFTDIVDVYTIYVFTEMDFGEIQFRKSPEGNSYKSFFIDILFPSGYIDLTALTMAVLDNGLTYKRARSTAREFILAYDGSTVYSDLKTFGDYTLVFYITPNHEFMLNIMNKSEINAPVDKSQYHEASYQDILSAKEPGEKICVRGRVEKQYTEYADPYFFEIVIFSSEGKRYRTQFSYPQFLKKFAVGNDYTFYGSVTQPMEDGYACINLGYFEE